MQKIVPLIVGLFMSSCVTPTDQVYEEKLACVLYTKDLGNEPLTRYKCVELGQHQQCDESVLNAENAHGRLWREYPEENCMSPKIVSILSDKYLLEGVD